MRLIDRDSGKDYPLQSRVTPDGRFAFYGNPATAFPEFASREVHLRVEASTPFHQTDGQDIDLAQVTGDPPQPAEAVYPEPLPGLGEMRVLEFNASGLPFTTLHIELDRLPVRLAGRVVSSNDPLVGLPGASVQVDPAGGGPLETTDAGGRFEFPDPLLPVAVSVEIEVILAGYEDTSLTVDLDYTSPLNVILVVMKKN